MLIYFDDDMIITAKDVFIRKEIYSAGGLILPALDIKKNLYSLQSIICIL